MANHQSAKKRIRQNETRRVENRYLLVTMRNFLRKFRASDNKEEVTELYPKACSMLDKLAKTGKIHKNKASNLKSKLHKHLTKI